MPIRCLVADDAVGVVLVGPVLLLKTFFAMGVKGGVIVWQFSVSEKKNIPSKLTSPLQAVSDEYFVPVQVFESRLVK